MESVQESRMCAERLTKDNIASVLQRYETFLMDCDGVLWENAAGDKFDGIKESVEQLRSMGKRLIFISNNPRNTKASFLEKFQNLCGFTAEWDDILLINEATVSYLRHEIGAKGKVYLFGSKHTSQALEDAGFDVVGYGENPEAPVGDLNTGVCKLKELKLDDNIAAVVMSSDGYFDYNKLVKAATYLRDPKCVFVATSDEPNMLLGVPGGRQLQVPVTGALLACLEAAADRKATVVGKPAPYYFRFAQRIHPHLDPGRTVIIGDMLASDVAFAANCGLESILVCTGLDNETTLAEAQKKNPKVDLPTYIMEGFADIAKLLSE